MADLLKRFLEFKGFEVTHVMNITDVGHLENDADVGEDKVGKKARLEQLEPMEIVQYYTNRIIKIWSSSMYCHRALSPMLPDISSSKSI